MLASLLRPESDDALADDQGIFPSQLKGLDPS